MTRRILITGAAGQIGQNLVDYFSRTQAVVIATDLIQPNFSTTAKNYALDVTDKLKLNKLVDEFAINEIYHLAAILSAKGESEPQKAWNINMTGLFNILDAAKIGHCKVFWPSSIAIFGDNSPKQHCPQHTVTEPTTVYGISKLAGEHWCAYYFKHAQVDVRSVRFPGLISWKGAPGGGTTDYAVEIFHEAIAHHHYTSFLSKDTELPMMYMDDAIRAIDEIMCAQTKNISIRSSYNIAGTSFSPNQLAAAIRHFIPDFTIDYKPDFREEIAESWPSSIEDTYAQKDWHWHAEYDLNRICEEMIKALSIKA